MGRTRGSIVDVLKVFPLLQTHRETPGSSRNAPQPPWKPSPPAGEAAAGAQVKGQASFRSTRGDADEGRLPAKQLIRDLQTSLCLLLAGSSLPQSQSCLFCISDFSPGHERHTDIIRRCFPAVVAVEEGGGGETRQADLGSCRNGMPGT